MFPAPRRNGRVHGALDLGLQANGKQCRFGTQNCFYSFLLKANEAEVSDPPKSLFLTFSLGRRRGRQIYTPHSPSYSTLALCNTCTFSFALPKHTCCQAVNVGWLRCETCFCTTSCSSCTNVRRLAPARPLSGPDSWQCSAVVFHVSSHVRSIM